MMCAGGADHCLGWFLFLQTDCVCAGVLCWMDSRNRNCRPQYRSSRQNHSDPADAANDNPHAASPIAADEKEEYDFTSPRLKCCTKAWGPDTYATWLARYIVMLFIIAAMFQLALLFCRMLCEFNCMCRVMYFFPEPASGIGHHQHQQQGGGYQISDLSVVMDRIRAINSSVVFHTLFPRWTLAANLCQH